MVGSTISGFGSDVSDVDMCLVHSANNGPIYVGNDLRIHSAKILKDFEELLRKNGSVIESTNNENISIHNHCVHFALQQFTVISI